ncbi:MAG: (2Fe-2S)-binding protein, partial [Deltaproteobacteria bacterium]|nr:(2Fe-2S)-binding protein [Deltaproteobacteria bacterium]
ETLLDLLRRYGLTGTKKGCGEGTCGSCVVLLDGLPVNACMVFAPQAAGHQVITVEGIGSIRAPHPIQQELVRAGAIQCGFCAPGMVLSIHALLRRSPDPDDTAIRQALDGNLCRCTGYVKILEAVHSAARRLREEGDGER